MILTILGRQPVLGIAELERVFGGKSVTPLSNLAALVETNSFDIQKLGGILKAGLVIDEISANNWSQINQIIISRFTKEWSSFDGKITLGISVYDIPVNPRDIQKTGIVLKQTLKKHNVSLRLIPQNEPALNTATSHHNKLGLAENKVELIIARAKNGKIYIVKSTGAQNITAYANRDQKRPKRDAFVGMLPPKLAQIMINLACGRLEDNKSQMQSSDSAPLLSTILDPFCGTGVILQEAALMGYAVYGTDLSEKMVSYSQTNLEWLADTHHKQINFRLNPGDAQTEKWDKPIDAVVGETYLGQPFSAPPSHSKLIEVVGNCDHIISGFLRNLGKQIDPCTPVCIAVPAWRDKNGFFTHLPLIGTIARLGYKPHEFMNVSSSDLLYYREDQIVARELLVLTKI